MQKFFQFWLLSSAVVLGTTPSPPIACARRHTGVTPESTPSSDSSDESPLIARSNRHLKDDEEDDDAPEARQHLESSWHIWILTAILQDNPHHLNESLDAIRRPPEKELDLDFVLDVPNAHMSPLQQSIASRSFYCFTELLRAGADPNFTAPETKSPLMMVVNDITTVNSAELARALLDAGASCAAVDQQDKSVLICVCKYGGRKLLDAIWGPSAKSTLGWVDDHGFTALHHLAENCLLATWDSIAAICEHPFNPTILPILDMGQEAVECIQCEAMLQAVILSPLERAIALGRHDMAAALIRFGALPLTRRHVIRSFVDEEDRRFHGLLAAAQELYHQCRQEIVTLMLHCNNPRLHDGYLFLKDVFRLIWPHLRYRNRIQSLFIDYPKA